MKKIIYLLLITTMLIAVCCVPIVAQANAAAPDITGVGSGVTFDTYYDIEVTSEVLDIVFDDRTATVTATYTMVNLTDSSLDVDTMFILPAEDIGNSYRCAVTQDGNALAYTTSNYSYADYDTSLTIEDWQYIVENGYEGGEVNDYLLQIATVNYTMSFEATATSTIVVSYDTQLGGAISYSTTVELLYYLTPAQYWADFSNLTINLTLDENHPSLDKSRTSLDFAKTGDCTYQYTSNTLPDTELTIVAQQSAWDRFSSSATVLLLFAGTVVIIMGAILCAVVVAVLLIVRVVKYSRSSVSVKAKYYYRKRAHIMLIVLGVMLLLFAIGWALCEVASVIFMIVVYLDIALAILLAGYGLLLLDSYLRNRRAIARDMAPFDQGEQLEQFVQDQQE